MLKIEHYPPAPRRHSGVVVMQDPLNADNVTLCLFQQCSLVNTVNAKLGLVVGRLVLKEVTLKVILCCLVLFVEERLQAVDF